MLEHCGQFALSQTAADQDPNVHAAQTAGTLVLREQPSSHLPCQTTEASPAAMGVNNAGGQARLFPPPVLGQQAARGVAPALKLLQGLGQHEGAVPVRDGQIDVPHQHAQRGCQVLQQLLLPAPSEQS